MEPRKGAIAFCSEGQLGLITSDAPVSVFYTEGLGELQKGLAWIGIHLMDHVDPFGQPGAAGAPWSSRNPRVVAHVDDFALEEDGATTRVSDLGRRFLVRGDAPQPGDGPSPTVEYTPPLRVLVCGGRDYDDEQAVLRRFGALPPHTIIIHGAARGADTLADRVALQLGFEVRSYPADWNHEGPLAGPRRNRRMLEVEQPDLVLAFPGGTGTAHMISIARSAGVPVEEIPRSTAPPLVSDRTFPGW